MTNTTSINGYEMAITQKRIWQLQKQYNCSFRVTVRLQLNGQLDKNLLFSCLCELIDRHEIFKTNYQFQDTSLAYPFQVIANEKFYPLFEFTDVSGMGKNEQQDAVQKISHSRLSAKPVSGESLEALLIKEKETQHTLLISAPAIAADIHSLMNIVNELLQCYAAGDAKTSSPAFQFIQFSEWQNELLAAEEPAAKRIWGNRLDDLKPVTLPLEDTCSKPVNEFDAITSEEINIDRQKLLAFCQAKNYSVEQFLFSAWSLLLWHYTGKKSRLLLGRIINGRSLEHFEAINGPFAKTLPLRVSITEKELFDEICRTVQQEMELTSDWQDNFTWKYETNDTIPACAFNFEYIPVRELDDVKKDLSVRYTLLHSLTDWYKLKLFCIDFKGKADIHIHANTSYFGTESLACIRQQFSHLVNQVLENSELPVASLFTISPWEMKLVAEKFNATQRQFITDRSLISYIEEHGQNNPGSPALKFGDTVVSYQAFNDIANQWARYLSEQYKIGKGDIVAVSLERSAIQIICLLAILKTGAAYLPLDHTTPEERIRYILEDSNAKAIITGERLTLKAPAGTKMIDVALATEAVQGSSTVYKSVNRDPDDIFYVMYTSGSTGKPKGVLVPDQSIINYALWFQSEHQVTARDSAVLFSSIAFDLSYTALWPVLISGGALHVAADTRVFDPDSLLAILVNEKVTYIKLTPSHFNLLVNSNQFELLADSLSLRLIVLGGEPVQVKDIEYYTRFKKGTSFLNHYGPTETTVGVITHLIDTDDLGAFRQKPLIGRPNSNNHVYIVDEQNKLLPLGMLGEICIAGKSVTKGYLQRPDLTDQKFIPDNFSNQGKLYKTGDLGRWTAHGCIEFFGRKDFQVKIHGYRIELEEIEQAILACKDISKAFVTVNNKGTDLLAFFTCSKPVSAAELKQFLIRQLPEYMIPGSLVELQQFPLLPNGKIDRTNLINTTIMRTVHNDWVAPETELEQQLADLWKKALETDQVSIHDIFFDIGGNSFKLVGIFREFSKIYPGKISLTDLFKYNTIHSLAGFIGSKEQVKERSKQNNLSFEV